jgi:nucleotide-binding universal stress UspA family protein
LIGRLTSSAEAKQTPKQPPWSRKKISGKPKKILESAFELGLESNVKANPQRHVAEVEDSVSGPAHEFRIKRILLPTDFSESAERALNYALRLNELCHAEIWLLHVFELPEYTSLLSEEPTLSPEKSEEVLEEGKKRAVAKLENIASRRADKGSVIIPYLAIGVPFEEIVKFAAERQIDLIVISSHGRTGLMHLLLGSTTERVILRAPCPVTVVTQKSDNAD